MLKTNSKQARENILDWLASRALEEAKEINRFNRENGFEPMKEAEIMEDLQNSGFASSSYKMKKAAVYFIIRCFRSELEKSKGFGSEFEKFDYWMRSLPKVVKSEDFLLRDACEFLGRILEETLEERQKYSQGQAEKLMIYLTWKTINYVFEHEKKKEGKKSCGC